MGKQTIILILLQSQIGSLQDGCAADLVDELGKLSPPDEGDKVVTDRYRQKQVVKGKSIKILWRCAVFSNTCSKIKVLSNKHKTSPI